MSSGSYGTVSVGLTATPCPSNSQPLRESFSVYNLGSGKLYWGTDSSVTTATGFPCLPGFAADYGGPVWLVSDTAGQDVRWLLLR